jgi:hypothetical protein
LRGGQEAAQIVVTVIVRGRDTITEYGVRHFKHSRSKSREQLSFNHRNRRAKRPRSLILSLGFRSAVGARGYDYNAKLDGGWSSVTSNLIYSRELAPAFSPDRCSGYSRTTN